MATPRPAAPPGGEGWNGSSQAMLAPAFAPAPEPGPQVRAMGLKIHYTFDKDAKVNCLARHSYTLHVQTIPIDETNAIGVIDLRTCLHAVIECSPELATQDGDYTIYAVDYSECDNPLVGQGMLSWALDSMRSDALPQPPKLVTGRVTKNLLAVFGGGNKETLEVRLKLSESASSHRHVRPGSAGLQLARPADRPQEHQFADRPMESAVTPSGTSEWSTFMQANPQIGHGDQVSRVASSAPSQGPAPTPNSLQPFGHLAQPQGIPHDAQEIHRVAPTPVVEPSEQPGGSVANSRPSSRACNRAPRKKQPTGRPRGRPRKKSADGNTSGYEEATEGEEGPTRKKAKTTKVDKSASNPFAGGPESLRVAASTSGSLRNFRPVAASNAVSGSHLQEIPRAPTPIPQGAPFANMPGQGPAQSKLRPGQLSQGTAASPESRLQPLSPGQEDGRYPESQAPTPAYSDDSMASSPPVHRTTPFMQSSPPLSSPVLPPMPSTELPHHESSFANDELDDLFGEEAPRSGRGEGMPPRARPGKSTESRPMTKGVPMQVFQMQDGPTGQDMVHICSYNGAPHPESAPPDTLPPASNDAPSLPLKKDPPRSRPRRAPAAKKPRAALAPPPAMEPTPPPTTDAVEKRMSPAPTAEPSQYQAQPSSAPAPEPMQGVQQSEEPVKSPPKPCSDTTTMEAPLQQQDLPSTKQPKRRAPQSSKVKDVYPLVRSQSAGAMSLALPSGFASEPAGPSSLSKCVGAESSFSTPPAGPGLKRSASSGPLALPIPASDPVGPTASAQQMACPEQPKAPTPPMDAPPPASSPPPARSNKNRVKKHAIKQRLEEAIMNGEMPPFCSNCGAIETPTWRKIWIQEHEGTPEYCEYSEKPGKVTAIEIIKRDADDKPASYRLIKKSLGPADDKDAWQELLLCNPCGIWLTKCKCHRPPDRWDKDFSRIGQERRRKGTAGASARSRKPRSKSDALANLASDAYLLTDALGPAEPSSPKAAEGGPSDADTRGPPGSRCRAGETHVSSAPASGGSGGDLENRSNPGSTHSRGSGTAKSPVELEFDEAVGSTRRLLFQSPPRKDGAFGVLGELNVNMVQISDDFQELKRLAVDKESLLEDADEATNERHGTEALFKGPAVLRPSTPPPNSNGVVPPSPFKTPTRTTPIHRPITRSVSRSLRSIRLMSSPSQALLQQTPTKTPRLGLGLFDSAGRRRSPHNHQGEFEIFDTPINRSISQVFSDNNNFGLVDDLDLSSLPALDSTSGTLIDFGNLLSTDALMHSSPPADGSVAFDYRGSGNLWAQWTMDHSGGLQLDEEQQEN